MRSCPDSLRIRKHLADRTGFQGEIIEGAKVCYSCYKSHIRILRDDDTDSTDDDLLGIIVSLKMSLGSVSDIQSAMSRAMTDTCIYVANTIVKHEALLLPTVHEHFSIAVREHMSAINLQWEEDQVTAQWILSNLIVTLGNHLSYACKIRRYGTLLYRTNGDLLSSLTVSLHKMNQVSKTKNDTSTSVEVNTTAEIHG